MKKRKNNLEKVLGIKFKNKIFLKQALTHKSFNIKFNNEKLEFLGDRVIGLILSKKLFDLYPEEPEGILDKRFAKLVNRNTCSSIARKISLDLYILATTLDSNINKSKKKILSDACEALIGAVYLDKGYEFSEKFVLELWKNELLKSNITVIDAKTKLQEFSLKKYKKLPKYTLVNYKGPEHNPTFKISVNLVDSKKFFGIGSSKKMAEQKAAENLLKVLKI